MTDVTHRCSRCQDRFPLDDAHFYRSHTAKSGWQSRCKRCDNDKSKPGAVVTRRGYERPREKRAPSCRECLGLPWRRPRSKRQLCACGEIYAAEKPFTLEDVLRMPTESRRPAL